MEFSTRDARSASEVAQFCALKWPESGAPILDEKTGEPVGVMVLGATARSVHRALRSDARANLQSPVAKTGEGDTVTRELEDFQADFVKSAARVTAGFVHVERDGRAATVDDAEWFYGLYMFSVPALTTPVPGAWQNQSFAQQVLAFSSDLGNFVGNGSKPS